MENIVSIPYRHAKNFGLRTFEKLKSLVSIPYRHAKNSLESNQNIKIRFVSIPYRHAKNERVVLFDDDKKGSFNSL